MIGLMASPGTVVVIAYSWEVELLTLTTRDSCSCEIAGETIAIGPPPVTSDEHQNCQLALLTIARIKIKARDNAIQLTSDAIRIANYSSCYLQASII